ncbi:MAG: tRNA-uridine aminocarboxypropyltransferase [Deltaproteobacteria bacterium]
MEIAQNTPKCPDCWKPKNTCLCSEIQCVPTKTRVLVLQHPQEARNPLTSARLASLTLKNSVHRVGLNWRSLSAALGTTAESKDWAVLFLGTLKNSEKLPKLPFQVVTQKGSPVDPDSIRGIVILDGNWKQSKTLWWRNPWLLKLKRIVLNPEIPSNWGALRKQPRPECLSSIESLSFTLHHLKEKPEVALALENIFQKHVESMTRQ